MKRLLICILLISVVITILPASPAFSARTVVRAVLFYSPNCGHCHYVITEVLPPLFEKYGDQLQVVALDVTQPAEQELFMAALEYFKVEYPGVPLLVIGDIYLVGSLDIPEQLPGLIEKYLSQGGVDWSPVPGLAEALTSSQPAESALSEPGATAELAAAGAASPDPNLANADSLEARFKRDLLGNSLAVVVLVGLMVVFAAATLKFRRFIDKKPSKARSPGTWNWVIPLLCVIGLGVAGYLAFVEMTRAQAVCGPVGDCNTVQQSPYAMLFGIIPIGLLGMVGYVMILVAWTAARSANRRLAAYAALAQLGMTAFGVLFSIYLTFLEPFVIGATCAWCLTSAVIMAALLWLSLAPARPALSFLLHGDKYAFKGRNIQRTF